MKSSATTSGIERDCGDKFAPVAIAAQNLRKFPYLYASPEPDIPTGGEYVPDFGLLVLMTFRLALG